jgi:predicted DNA-binding protein
MTTVTIQLPDDLYQRINNLAERQSKTVEAVAEIAIAEYLRDNPGEGDAFFIDPDLMEEFAAWDVLSDEALVNVEAEYEERHGAR